jgi:flagella basal body P-ring formation protein FlgA
MITSAAALLLRNLKTSWVVILALALPAVRAEAARSTQGGPAAVQIPGSMLVSRAVMSQKAIDHLRHALQGRYEDVDVQLGSAMADLAVPAGDVTLFVRTGDLQRVSSRLPVWVDVAVNGKIERTVSAMLEVRASQRVYVARHLVPEGEYLASEDADVVLADVTKLSEIPLSLGELRTGIRTRRALRQGEIIRRTQIAAKADVMRGDPVKLTVVQAGLAVETIAKAQQDGVIGQRIRVKPTQSNDVVTAMIVDAGVVRMEER